MTPEALLLILIGAVAGYLLAAARTDKRWQQRTRELLHWLRDGQTTEPPDNPDPLTTVQWAVYKDTLKQAQAVQVVREQMDGFVQAMAASPVGLVLLDAQQTILWCSDMAGLHLGLGPERDRLARITHLVRDPVFVPFVQQLAASTALATPGPRAEVLMDRPDRGGRILLFGQRFAVPEAAGQTRILLVSQDVTERQRNELLQKEFVANVSHEVRTPLTVLSGYLDCLPQLQGDPNEFASALQAMRDQSVRMQRLVGDLLLLSRLDGAPRPMPGGLVPVQTWVDEAWATATALRKPGQTMTLGWQSPRLAQPDVAVLGHASELLSALVNVLNNAVRYSGPEGHITLWVGWLGERSPAGPATDPPPLPAWLGPNWRSLQASEGLCLAVIDSGPGIPADALPRLGERFFRVDKARSSDTGGTGLGLSIVRQVLQRHGGQMRVFSELGQGSCFVLLLPPLRMAGG
ncbi:ATP-binding protein [Amphibiibacter pelophylacis]|uniref:ATP-binding protein n=1 Tax=Amphibiibacter pelophylacis TaxID=1799477 RepID=A0ACC6P0H0_9BURK